MTRRLAVGLAALLALSIGRAEDPQPLPGDATSIAQELNAIRDQLVALDIEKALAGVSALLERPERPAQRRTAAAHDPPGRPQLKRRRPKRILHGAIVSRP